LYISLFLTDYFFCALNTDSEQRIVRIQLKIDELKNKTIVVSRFRPLFATHDEYLLLFIVWQNLVGISAVRPTFVVFYSRLGIQMTRHRAIM